MNAKVVILLVIAVAAIGGGVYFFMWNSSNSTDYTLFDSDDNIKEGLTIEIDVKDHGGSLYSKKIVDSVKDGRVNDTTTSKIKGMPLSNYSMDDFMPDDFANEYGFDYTSGELPETVTVEKEGDKYVIKGYVSVKTVKSSFDISIVYKNEKVTSVEGTIDEEPEYEDVKATITFSTVLGTLKASYSQTGTLKNDTAVDDFFDRISIFDAERYKDAKVTDGKLGNVNVKIYTVDGTYGGIDYIDVNMYVYNGHLLKQEGKIVDDGQEYQTYLLLKIRQA